MKVLIIEEHLARVKAVKEIPGLIQCPKPCSWSIAIVAYGVQVKIHTPMMNRAMRARHFSFYNNKV